MPWRYSASSAGWATTCSRMRPSTMPRPNDETGKKVAVVGSGPAGLAAAFYLRKVRSRGHGV